LKYSPPRSFYLELPNNTDLSLSTILGILLESPKIKKYFSDLDIFKCSRPFFLTSPTVTLSYA